MATLETLRSNAVKEMLNGYNELSLQLRRGFVTRNVDQHIDMLRGERHSRNPTALPTRLKKMTDDGITKETAEEIIKAVLADV